MAPGIEERETVQTLEQQRAQSAWARVSGFVDTAGSLPERHRTTDQ